MNRGLKIAIILLFIFFAYFFTYSYISQEHPLYACDYVEQNLFWHDFSNLLRNNLPEFFKNFSNDIYNHNRNPFIILFLLPFSFFMKDFRFGFVFSVEIMYMLPVMILILHLLNKYFLVNVKHSRKEILVILSTVLLFPSIWYPVLSGIPDIGGMISIFICFILYLKYGFNKKCPPLILILFAILLYISFLSRRWYSVVVFTFCISILIENIIMSIKSNNKKSQIGYTLLHLILSGVIFVIFALLFQGGYVRNIINAELEERSLYSFNINQLPVFYEHLGLLTCITAFIGFIIYHKNHLIRFSFLNLFIYIFIYIIVAKNQFLWINHFSYIAVCVCILMCSGLYKICSLIKNETVKNIFIVLMVAFNIFNFYCFFMIERSELFAKISARTTAYPVKSVDYDEIKAFYSYLENEYKKNSKIKIVLYGLNDNIGYWQFRSMNPDSEFAKNSISYDKIINDDFQDVSYDEDYAVLLNPLGIFAPDEEASTKIKEVEENFKNNTGFAKNYKKEKEIQLNDETKTRVILYKRK